MAIYEVKTKVFNRETNQFIGNSTATIDADDKDEARFQFYHGIILAFAPENQKIIPDMRTLKLKTQPLESASADDTIPPSVKNTMVSK